MCGLVVGDRVIDVGSEWRTFSNDKGGEDRSRVGGPENTLLGSSDLSTMIGPGQGAASFDGSGNPMYGDSCLKTTTYCHLTKPFSDTLTGEALAVPTAP